jgi:hypothetical protein
MPDLSKNKIAGCPFEKRLCRRTVRKGSAFSGSLYLNLLRLRLRSGKAPASPSMSMSCQKLACDLRDQIRRRTFTVRAMSRTVEYPHFGVRQLRGD